MLLPRLFRASSYSHLSGPNMPSLPRESPSSPQDSLVSPRARKRGLLQKKRLPDVPGTSPPSMLLGQSDNVAPTFPDVIEDQQVRQERHEVAPTSPRNSNEENTYRHDVPTPIAPRPSYIARSHRPSHLTFRHSFGFTNLPLGQLRQRISDHSQGALDIAEQFATPKPPRSRRGVRPPRRDIMGNHQSTHAHNHALPEEAAHAPIRVLRKSSTMLFNRRGDSITPFPPLQERPVAATSIVDQAPDSSLYGERPGPSGYAEDHQQPAHRARTPSLATHHSYSHLPVQKYRESAPRTSSATTVRRDARADPVDSDDLSGDSEYDVRPAALSPTIPDITALPEDSPHKYGLLDRMDTPVPAEAAPAQEATLQSKASRRFSGVELFREATSLASASSFLNGLSVCRRRAQSTGSWTHVPSRSRSRSHADDSTRPKSALPTVYNEHDERRERLNLKASGFAYSRPLGVTQLRCYRSHSRLLASPNKNAPVECAICHMDDDQDHYSCSWCALRMCRYCQRDFISRGLAALKERVKMAEMGDLDSLAFGGRRSKWDGV